MEYIYDLLIIGGGPAGLTAGIYAGRSKLDTLILERDNDFGGQIRITAEVVNYPGVFHTSGEALIYEMKKQALEFGVNFEKADVIDVDFSGDIKVVKTAAKVYKALAVIIATGAKPRTLGFAGEEEFRGRGVGYCATCDGQFFTNKDVFVIGAGFAAAEEAIFLTRYAKKIYVIAREPEFTCSKSIADEVFRNEKIEVHFNTEILEISGDTALRKACFANNQTKEKWEYNVESAADTFGVFVFIGYIPTSQVFSGHIQLDPYGYIPTNDSLETNVTGIYAAGDIRPKGLRQLVTATSDGAVAATCAEKYIQVQREKLNIKKEPVHKVEKKSAPDNSDFFNADIKAQLLPILDRFENSIQILAILDDDKALSAEMEEFLKDFSGLSEKVQVEILSKGQNAQKEKEINATVFPVMAIFDGAGKYTGMKFCGVPGGHEFNSFVIAAYNAAGPGQHVGHDVLERIAQVERPVKLQIGISLSCTMCPDVVMSSQLIARHNAHVEAEMIDIMHFEEFRNKHNLMSVPALVINDDEKVVFGKKNVEEILDILLA